MARKTKYIFKLSKSERGKLNKLVKTGKIAVAKRYRAQILLYADEGPDGPYLSDPQIAKIGNICDNGVKSTSTSN